MALSVMNMVRRAPIRRLVRRRALVASPPLLSRSFAAGLPPVDGPAARRSFVTGEGSEMPQLPVHLPPAENERELTVVLDMDETLIHSMFQGEDDGRMRQREARKQATTGGEEAGSAPPLEYFATPLPDGETVTTNKRPHLGEFLARLQALPCEVVIFTAAVPHYASPVLDTLEREFGATFRHRLYRGSCDQRAGHFLKDLRVLGRDLRRTVLVDNNPYCFLPQPSNGVPIASFYDQRDDAELLRVANLVELLCRVDKGSASPDGFADVDVRPILDTRFGLAKKLANYRKQVYPGTPFSRL